MSVRIGVGLCYAYLSCLDFSLNTTQIQATSIPSSDFQTAYGMVVQEILCRLRLAFENHTVNNITGAVVTIHPFIGTSARGTYYVSLICTYVHSPPNHIHAVPPHNPI
jgi:hypothetical protein